MIYTIGHSTHAADEFVALLRAHGVEQVADVRTVPRSKRNPQFGRDVLDGDLAARGLRYRHFPELGGLRHPRKDSLNSAWQNDSFRGYADYMSTVEFGKGVDALLAFAGGGSTAVMCAEAVWWRCHRRLLADALLQRDVEVRHIVSGRAAEPHHLTEFARPNGGVPIYPGLLDADLFATKPRPIQS